jgi:hypothetical protein
MKLDGITLELASGIVPSPFPVMAFVRYFKFRPLHLNRLAKQVEWWRPNPNRHVVLISKPKILRSSSWEIPELPTIHRSDYHELRHPDLFDWGIEQNCDDSVKKGRKDWLETFWIQSSHHGEGKRTLNTNNLVQAVCS